MPLRRTPSSLHGVVRPHLEATKDQVHLVEGEDLGIDVDVFFRRSSGRGATHGRSSPRSWTTTSTNPTAEDSRTRHVIGYVLR